MAKQDNVILSENIELRNRLFKLNEAMENDKELFLIKGQLISSDILEKVNSRGHYMIIKVKTVKASSDDIYSQRTNIFQIIIAEERCFELTSSYIRDLTGCEVLCFVEVTNILRKSNNSQLSFNNISYYLKDIIKIRDIK